MSHVSRQSRSTRVVALVGLVMWLAGSGVSRVAACSAASADFTIDPNLRESDSDAPAPFGSLTAFTRRVSATRCAGKTCTQSTCGDHGQLELQFDARDEGVDPAGIGYRVVWLSGELPEPVRGALDGVKPLAEAGRITLDVGWNEVTALSGELALVAVDHAGNESAPSDPVQVEWSGCTSYWDDPTCRPATTSRVSGGAANGCELAAITRTGSRASLVGWLSAAALALARVQRRRVRARA
jgi:hypothetical protein